MTVHCDITLKATREYIYASCMYDWRAAVILLWCIIVHVPRKKAIDSWEHTKLQISRQQSVMSQNYSESTFYPCLLFISKNSVYKYSIKLMHMLAAASFLNTSLLVTRWCMLYTRLVNGYLSSEHQSDVSCRFARLWICARHSIGEIMYSTEVTMSSVMQRALRTRGRWPGGGVGAYPAASERRARDASASSTAASVPCHKICTGRNQ